MKGEKFVTLTDRVISQQDKYMDSQTQESSSIDVLNLLRQHRESERRLRSKTRAAMKIGESDLIALRFLIKQKTAGRLVLQKDLAQLLGITSASTTVLVDRLSKNGHARRIPHPTDRRASVVESTEKTDNDVMESLSDMHQLMVQVVDQLTEEETNTVAKFLVALNEAVQDSNHDAD